MKKMSRGEINRKNLRFEDPKSNSDSVLLLCQKNVEKCICTLREN